MQVLGPKTRTDTLDEQHADERPRSADLIEERTSLQSASPSDLVIR